VSATDEIAFTIGFPVVAGSLLWWMNSNPTGFLGSSLLGPCQSLADRVTPPAKYDMGNGLVCAGGHFSGDAYVRDGSSDASGLRFKTSRGKIILSVCEVVHIPPASQALNRSPQGLIGHGGQFHAHDRLGCGHMRDRAYGLVNVDAAQAQGYDAENATDGLTGKAAHGNLEMRLRCLTRKQN
jgi:hypothetical protein